MMKKYLWSFALSAIVLAGCGKKEEPVAVVPAPVASAPAAAPVNTEEKVLNIYNWADYVPEGMIATFEKETGIKVNYDTFETNEALHAKLVAGNSGYDIVVPGSVFAKPQIEGGLLQALGCGVLGSALEDPADLPPPAPKLLALGGSVLAHVHRVVHDAAEGVDGKDRLALGARQEEEGVEEVGAALAGQTGDEALGVHAARLRAEGRRT